MRPTLYLMLKEPHPGRVKTRLARGIGAIAAAHWYRHQTATLIRRLDDPRWHLTLAVSPDTEGLASRVWPRHLPRVPQGPGDLGARMARLLRGAPPGPALVIGSDIPALGPAHIARAFRALARADAVLGPAPDGGYWCVGLRRAAAPPARLFHDVRWSTPHALKDTARTLPARTALADTLADVDTAADLRDLPSRLANAPRRAIPRP